MNIKTSKELVDEANKEIKVLNAEEVKTSYEKGDLTLIDIRDIRELWREGTIKNSIHIPRGMLEFWLDPQSSYFQENKIGDSGQCKSTEYNTKVFYFFLNLKCKN